MNDQSTIRCTQARRQDFAAGGPKTTRGATFLKYNIGCMQQPWGQTWNGGHRFQMGWSGTTGSPGGDGPTCNKDYISSGSRSASSISSMESQDDKITRVKAGLRSRSRKESEVFGWCRSRIPKNTRSRSLNFFVQRRLRISNWIIFYITLLSWEFLLKWCNFFWNFCRIRNFLLCTTISTDFNSQTSELNTKRTVVVGKYIRSTPRKLNIRFTK